MPLQTFLKGRRAVAAAIEATEHTAESLSVSNANLRVYDVGFSLRPQQSARNYARSSFSPVPFVPAGTAVDLTFGVEIACASAGATTEPPWSKLLRACGCHYALCRTLTPGTITGGPVRHGEVIIQATTGATAIVVNETASGATTLRYELLTTTDFNASNLVTAQTSGATFTPSAVAGSAGSQAWWPTTFPTVYLTLNSGASGSSGNLAVGSIIVGGTSAARGELVYYALTTDSVVAIVRPIKGQFQAENLSDAAATWTGVCDSVAKADAPTLTIGLYLDGKLLVVRGCRGTFDVRFEANVHPIIRFSFQGVIESHADVANVTPTNYGTRSPVAFKSAALAVNGSSIGLINHSISLGLGNTVVLPSSADDSEGFYAAQITERTGSIQIDPQAVVAAVKDFFTELRNGTRYALQWSLGTASPNLFDFTVPALMSQNIEDAERSGIFVFGASGYGSAGLYGSQAAVEGRDQDWIMVNR